MLHGKGIGNYDENSQLFLTKKYHDKREKGLEDKNTLTDSEILYYEISGSDGQGRTDSDKYQIWQFPFPADASIRSKKKVDLRILDKVGK